MTMVKQLLTARHAVLLANLGIFAEKTDDQSPFEFVIEYDDELGFARVEAPKEVETPPLRADRAPGDTSLNKLRVDLVPVEHEYFMAFMLTAGQRTYDPRGWEKGRRWGNEYAAVRRHLGAWWGRETNDPEFGVSHLWSALTRLSMLATMEARRVGSDDRPWSSMTGVAQPTTAMGENPDYQPHDTTHGVKADDYGDKMADELAEAMEQPDTVAGWHAACGVGVDGGRCQTAAEAQNAHDFVTYPSARKGGRN